MFESITRNLPLVLLSVGIAAAVPLFLRLIRSRCRIKAIHVAEIWVYPVKGCRGQSMKEWPLCSTGLLLDRTFALLHRNGDGAFEVVTCNKYSALCSVEVSIRSDKDNVVTSCTTDQFEKLLTGEGYCISISAPSMATALVVSLVAPVSGSRHSISIFGMAGAAQEVSDECNAWWSRCLGRDVVFCRIIDRDVEGDTGITGLRLPTDSVAHHGALTVETDRIAFHDFAALHLISTEGVAWLQRNVPSGHLMRPLSTRQFRANIVVCGTLFPDEDSWKLLSFSRLNDSGSSMVLRVAKQSGRCMIPTYDDNGIRNKYFEPTATLRRLRSRYHRHQIGKEGSSLMFMFGLDLFANATSSYCSLAVGDTVTVLERYRES